MQIDVYAVFHSMDISVVSSNANAVEEIGWPGRTVCLIGVINEKTVLFLKSFIF